MSDIVCPICGNNDQIQKVSAIVQSGTSSYQASGPSVGTAFIGGKMGLATGFTSVSGINQTGLAKQLIPPAEPKKPGFRKWIVAVVIYIYLTAMGGLCAGLTGSQPIAQNYLVGIVCLVIAILVFVYEKNRVARKTTSYNQSIKKAQWEEAVKRWSQLYYCFRDDIVFDPTTGKFYPPSQMNSLLYS